MTRLGAFSVCVHEREGFEDDCVIQKLEEIQSDIATRTRCRPHNASNYKSASYLYSLRLHG